MSNKKKRVAIGMSGGVDSSTSAFLLRNEGYDVVGVTAIMYDNLNPNSPIAAVDAKSVCDFLGIDHHTVDLTKVFTEKVINYLLETYKRGKTPNPCAVCNKQIKWGAMYDYAKNELNCELLATGHYALLEHAEGKYKIKRPADRTKDQTYMLINLTQEDLARTIFPLGYLEKEQVKQMARKNKIPTAERPESQDICFIEKDDKLQNYLERHLGENPGDIIDCSTGKKIGEHTGIYRYTIGQRKGIKVAYPYPLYVISIDTENNIIYVGAKEDIEQTTLIVTDINWIAGIPESEKFFALTKIRYNSRAKLAQVEMIEETSANVAFENPQFAITPGQVAAFYSLDNTYLLGGGWIQ